MKSIQLNKSDWYQVLYALEERKSTWSATRKKKKKGQSFTFAVFCSKYKLSWRYGWPSSTLRDDPFWRFGVHQKGQSFTIPVVLCYLCGLLFKNICIVRESIKREEIGTGLFILLLLSFFITNKLYLYFNNIKKRWNYHYWSRM